ncbi:hypothetical protein C5167_006427 [Papaver somniferum]|uniref:Uncharacterized protein n=1 Tax=Papaver somniferum TaxID=3469 RepID=A0A4Y7JF25_PAPSO|nr:hypothetical protein C5167_006427 [Papaver somniferum]
MESLSGDNRLFEYWFSAITSTPIPQQEVVLSTGPKEEGLDMKGHQDQFHLEKAPSIIQLEKKLDSLVIELLDESKQLLEVHDRLACIISMENENSSMNS